MKPGRGNLFSGRELFRQNPHHTSRNPGTNQPTASKKHSRETEKKCRRKAQTRVLISTHLTSARQSPRSSSTAQCTSSSQAGKKGVKRFPRVAPAPHDAEREPRQQTKSQGSIGTHTCGGQSEKREKKNRSEREKNGHKRKKNTCNHIKISF